MSAHTVLLEVDNAGISGKRLTVGDRRLTEMSTVSITSKFILSQSRRMIVIALSALLL